MDAVSNYIKFTFNPFEFIQEGIDIVAQNNLSVSTNFSEITSFKSANNRRSIDRGVSWHGYDPNSPLTAQQQFDINSGLGSFLDQKLLNDMQDIFSNISAKLDLGKDSKPRRIMFTSKPIGVFSFAQASKGLIRATEFYCVKTKEVIDKDKVQKKQILGNDFFFYVKNGEEIELQKRQEGTTDIEKNCKNVVVKLDEKTNFYLPYRNGQILLKCDGYRLRFASTIQKVYAYREKKGGGVAPYVDLYIPIGGNWKLDYEQMLIQAMPSIMLGRILERSGVRVRVFAVFSATTFTDDSTFQFLFMVKNYGETLDINKLSVFCADVRFYRYYLFNTLIGHAFSLSGNRNIRTNNLATIFHIFNSESLPLIRNYVDYKIKVGEFPSQVIDKKLMIYAGIDVTPAMTIEDASTQQLIIREFYKKLDYIQLNLSKSPKDVMKEIIKRKERDGDSLYAIRSYLIDIVTDIYKPTSQIQAITPSELKKNLQSGNLTQQEYDDLLRVNIQLDTAEEQEEIRQNRARLIEIINTLIP